MAGRQTGREVWQAGGCRTPNPQQFRRQIQSDPPSPAAVHPSTSRTATKPRSSTQDMSAFTRRAYEPKVRQRHDAAKVMFTVVNGTAPAIATPSENTKKRCAAARSCKQRGMVNKAARLARSRNSGSRGIPPPPRLRPETNRRDDNGNVKCFTSCR